MRFSLAVAAALIIVGPVSAQESLDEILAQHYEARGGLEALKGVESLRMNGNMTMGPMEMPITIEMKRPQQVRMEFTMQGMTGVQAYDGETAWAIMPFMGKTDPEPMPEDQAKDLEEMADIDGELVDYAKKGHKLSLVGKEDLDGTEVYHLKLEKKNGDVADVYLDAEYYLEVERKTKAERQGAEIVMTSTVGDYKEVDGLMLPHSIANAAEGAPGSMNITIESYEVNPDVDSGRFTMPAAAEKAVGE